MAVLQVDVDEKGVFVFVTDPLDHLGDGQTVVDLSRQLVAPDK